MTGKDSTKEKVRKEPTALVQPLAHAEMPDPDNLRIDLSSLPRTGPITFAAARVVARNPDPRPPNSG